MTCATAAASRRGLPSSVGGRTKEFKDNMYYTNGEAVHTNRTEKVNDALEKLKGEV